VSGHYVAIAECPTAPGEAWRISFPSFPGVLVLLVPSPGPADVT
jgi:hypothetical protein